MTLDRMIWLYPAEWRERYADEMLALLAQMRGGGPRTALDLALGAVDAWLHPSSAQQELPGSVNPLRSASVSMFCAWAAFVLAGLIFYATLDDNPLTTLGHSTAGLGLSVLVVEAGAALSLLAVLVGAAPIGLALLGAAMEGRRDGAWLMFGVPLLCACILAAYLAGMVLWVGSHPAHGAPLFIVFQGLCVLAALVSTAAISAAVLRSEPRSGPFRLARVAALPVSLSMALTLLGLIAWGASAVTTAPAAFYTSPGWLSLDTAHAWLLASVVMATATTVALLTTVRSFARPGVAAAPKA